MSAYSELCQLVAELSLISHTSAISYESARDAGEDIGGRKPPGGDRETPNRRDRDEYDAFLGSYHRRTVDYFTGELVRCKTTDRIVELRDEARETLEAWRRTPAPAPGIELKRGSFYWKCAIADDDRDIDTIRRVYTVGRATAYRYRAKYRGLRGKRPHGGV